MEKIISLSEISFDEIFEAFSIAFKDYEMQLDKQEFHTMIHRRGFVKDLSFGAFIDDKLVSLTLNGIDNFLGCKTAYDTGTGTIEEYRGKGLAGKIFDYSLPFLKDAGVEKYLLEVLQHNEAAVSVYKKAGFSVQREFGYYVMENSELSGKLPSSKYTIDEISIDHIKQCSGFMDFEPSWQNSIASIERNADMFKKIGIVFDGKIAGFGVFEPGSGDITLLAVEHKHRDKGIASGLIKKMTELNQHNEIKMINTDLSTGTMTNFMKAIGFPLSGKQFEMTRDL